MILLPHSPSTKNKVWLPRNKQLPLWQYLAGGGKRAIAIWHRRFGKDELALHWASVAMHQRIGTYWHMLPQAAQARKAIWQAIDPRYGIPRIDVAFPQEIRESTNSTEMFIKARCGSTWQVVGSDNYNSLVGSPPVGVVFSEWALADPQAWAYLRPILLENNGWALFITTSRGSNHAKTMFVAAQDDPNWFADMQRADETGIFTDEQLATELREYQREYGAELGRALFNQEYMCSFEGAVLGAYYGKEMQQALEAGRITSVPYDENYPVNTSWDLGVKDSTVIIYYQEIGSQIRVIDCDAFVHTGLADMVRTMNAKPYIYNQHKGPHDLNVQELGSGISRLERAQQLGVRFTVAPNLRVIEGISAARALLSRCVFDADKCATLIEALSNYRAKWDQEKKALSKTPDHDWTSDYADSFRYYAVTPTESGDWGQLDYTELNRVMR